MAGVITKAQLAILFGTGFAVAFMGWAVVYLASSPKSPNKNDQRTRSRFRRWLRAMLHRLLTARE